jgi:hypothetical protein
MLGEGAGTELVALAWLAMRMMPVKAASADATTAILRLLFMRLPFFLFSYWVSWSLLTSMSLRYWC